ncbi:MAG: hypothetical protein HY238_10905 [Acidobacteria bacterium]|nr:hypothetical protein [Acidobacteriota bacterium]
MQPIIRGFEHEQACKEALSSVALKLHGETTEECEEATAAAETALESLPVGASRREMERERDGVLAPIQARIDTRRQREQDQARRQDVLSEISWKLPWGLPEDEKQEALEAARKAIAKLPEGTARSELERVRDKAIQPFLDDHARREKKARLIEPGLREIYPYLLKLERGWEFDKSAWTLDDELKPTIREALEEELEGDESAEQVAGLVRRLVREELRL